MKNLSAIQIKQMASVFIRFTGDWNLRRQLGVFVSAWQLLVRVLIEGGNGRMIFDNVEHLHGFIRSELHLAVDDWEAFVSTCLGTGTISYDKTCLELGLTADFMPTRAQIASRENGKKGGRPRKNPYDVPGQRRMLLPVRGGKAARRVSGTSLKIKNINLSLSNNDGPVENVEKLTHGKGAKRPGDSINVNDPRVVEIYERCAGWLWGMSGLKNRAAPDEKMNAGIVKHWARVGLERGWEVEAIVALIYRKVPQIIADHQAGGGAEIRHLGYFHKAIVDTMAAVEGENVETVPVEVRERQQAHLKALKNWRPGQPVTRLCDYMLRNDGQFFVKNDPCWFDRWDADYAGKTGWGDQKCVA